MLFRKGFSKKKIFAVPSEENLMKEYDALQESGNNRDAAIIDVEDFKKLSVIFIFVGFIVSFFS